MKIGYITCTNIDEIKGQLVRVIYGLWYCQMCFAIPAKHFVNSGIEILCFTQTNGYNIIFGKQITIRRYIIFSYV